MREVDRLAAPAAWERAEAVDRIAELPGDIAADLRVAYRYAADLERCGLLQAAQKRADTALVQHAAVGLSDADERVAACARDYLLAAVSDSLKVDAAEMDETQIQAWRDFRAFRMRRDISRMLIEAYLKPGKYIGQFDAMRRADAGGLDRELLALLRADPLYREPLELAATERIELGIEPNRMFSQSWRVLSDGLPAIKPAISYYATGETEAGDAVRAELEGIALSRFQSALTLVNDLRATAVRALALSDARQDIGPRLVALYRSYNSFQPAASLRSAIDPEILKTEIEITLARYGVIEPLRARIEGLRRHVQPAEHAPANVSARPAPPRADLMVQNQIAQLLLRAGDYQGAEREWQSATASALEQMQQASGRSRATLVSFAGSAFYNLACAQALQLKLSRGLESLKLAVEHGYKDFAWVLEDGDLAHLRRQPEFVDWFKRVAPPAVVDSMRDDE
jgi:hypothetical protein